MHLDHLDGVPDLVFNAGPGVGGEGQAARGVEPQDGTPQTDATGLQGFAEGQIPQHLLAHDSLDQTVVALHQPVQALGTTGLRLSKQGGLREVNSGATRCVGMNEHRAPPQSRCPIMVQNAVGAELSAPGSSASNTLKYPELYSVRKVL